jgi:hypothetical protein
MAAGRPSRFLCGLLHENREGNLLYSGRPLWNPLRSDARVLDLLRRLNLPLEPRK